MTSRRRRCKSSYGGSTTTAALSPVALRDCVFGAAVVVGVVGVACLALVDRRRRGMIALLKQQATATFVSLLDVRDFDFD